MSIPPNANYLNSIRLFELSLLLEYLKDIAPERARILEVGAGTGWQARELATHGYQVSAIDIPTSNHSHARVWEVIDFDGRYIPFEDHTFDIIYSSNVIEHVEDLNTLNHEFHRVLKTTGFVFHYVPTSSWRAWSLLAFYPSLLLDVFRRIYRPTRGTSNINNSNFQSSKTNSCTWKCMLTKLYRRLIPHTHGSSGLCLTELYRYRRTTWLDYFQSADWIVINYTCNRLFLTGEMLFGRHLSIHARAKLSKLFGSTAHFFILKSKI